MNIGSISKTEFWEVLRGYGFDIDRHISGGTLMPFRSVQVGSTVKKNAKYEVDLGHGDVAYILPGNMYINTVRMVEKWLKFKIFL